MVRRISAGRCWKMRFVFAENLMVMMEKEARIAGQFGLM